MLVLSTPQSRGDEKTLQHRKPVLGESTQATRECAVGWLDGPQGPQGNTESHLQIYCKQVQLWSLPQTTAAS